MASARQAICHLPFAICTAVALLLSACDQSPVTPSNSSPSPAPSPQPSASATHPSTAQPANSKNASATPHPLQRLAVPQHGIYTGAYVDWGDKEDTVTLEDIERFEKLVDKHQAIIASSSYWGEQTFPDENVRLINRHGSVPLIFWSPWDKPYVEGRGPDKYSLTSIIAGEHDAYIDMWAEKARDFGGPIVVSFANEMNGEWFPWSGKLYGGSTPLPDTKPVRFQGPETFKKAYRHVVDRVRAKGATNVQWVLHLMNYSLPQEGWNLASEYYPGPEYCDWLGISLYGAQFADDDWSNFFPLIDWPYEELRRIDATKPVMICEWAVGEFPQLGSKANWIRDAFRLFKSPKYPNIKACVYWHERWQNDDGRYSNLHVNSTPDSLEAYRQGVADPTYLSEPIVEGGK
jgi:beta-mannanase